ncbi:MAG: efflux RND transporter permease subunit, partial [Alphaproteobacteria bacterium]
MIGFFARHPTAANIMMLMWLALGLTALPEIGRATFPDVAIDSVYMGIPYPGAAAEEVETAVCLRVEQAVASVMDRKQTICEAQEGSAFIIVRTQPRTDIDRFTNDVQSAVDSITDFPEIVERPRIYQSDRATHVVAILVTGIPESTGLKAYVEDLRERMTLMPTIAKVDMAGFSERQIRVAIDRRAMQALGLSADQVSRAIEAQNIEIPAGLMETRDKEILLRFSDERHGARPLEDVILKSDTMGGEVRLGDIAEISDGFSSSNTNMTINGERGAILFVNKSREDDSLTVLESVYGFLDQERAQLPDGMQLRTTFNAASLIDDRLTMLTKNGMQGLLLVFLTMWLFFSLRYSVWVAMGLPVSFAGTFFFMNWFGYSFDLISVIGLLIGIGLLMDDAIVIAENIATHHAKGKTPVDAAIDGTKQVLPGVAMSYLTTMCIFAPLTLLTGEFGEVLKLVPIILIMTLTVSLTEAFLILPHHLKTSLEHHDENERGEFKQKFEDAIDRFRENVLLPMVRFAIRHRYGFLGSVLALFIFCIGLIPMGIVKFTPFPQLDGDTSEINLIMPRGTPFEETEYVMDQIEAALWRANDRFSPQPNGENVIVNAARLRGGLRTASERGNHASGIIVDLVSAEERTVTMKAFEAAFREELPDMPGIESLTFRSMEPGPGGADIGFRLTATGANSTAILNAASDELQEWLRGYDGVVDVGDNIRPGKPEYALTLKEGATSLGLSASDIARQLRGAYYGSTALQFQSGNESYEIDVRLSDDDRSGFGNLDGFLINAPTGAQIPLSAVANVTERRGDAMIRRIDGNRSITVTAYVSGKTNAAEVTGDSFEKMVPALLERYPGLSIQSAGASEEAAETGASIGQGFLLGLFAVYLLLAFQFRNYLEPIVVMFIIPFSFIGVMIGHLVLGMNLTMPSFVGFTSLAGVVVNNSILLVTFIRIRRAEGLPVAEAAAQASRDRFRAVLLTSATTVAGLLPILTETSLQAQIIIPLVTSI